MMRKRTSVSRNCWRDDLGIRLVRRNAWRFPGMLMAWFNSCGKRKKQSRWVYTSLLNNYPTVPGANHTLTVTSGSTTWCNDFHDWFIVGRSLHRCFTTNSERSSLLPPQCTPKRNPHIKWKTIWKLKATMRGRMTVLQFLVILTVKSQIHHHSLLTLPLSTYSGYEGRWQDPNGRGHCVRFRGQRSTACCITTSDILVF